MIYETSSPLLIPKLLELAELVPNLPIPELEKILINGISSPNSKILIEEKDDEVRGFLFASIESFDGQDCCFVQVCAVKPTCETNIVPELVHRIKLWAKEKQVEYLYFMTRRNSKGFERKYHFDFYGTVLRKKVEEDVKSV